MGNDKDGDATNDDKWSKPIFKKANEGRELSHGDSDSGGHVFGHQPPVKPAPPESPDKDAKG